MPSALIMHVGIPLMVADVAQMLVNAVLLAGVVRLSTGIPPRRFIVQMVTNSGVAYIGYGVIGFLFVILWGPADVGWFSAVLILAPLYVARWAFVQYGEEQRAHERTLSALVTVVETKDPSAAGHSGRIARLAEWMAEPLSMGTQEVQALVYAAMLHDVGKVGVPTRLLRRPRTWTPADLETLTHHSALGVVLVREIEFLNGSLDGIRHHHERWDGLGYPDGLAGDEIPLVSRVIAVADAFDALTTDRAERPAFAPQQALQQIEQRRGRQFDPHVVAALATVLERHDWPITSADEDRLDRMRGYLDHDDPIAWEQVWATGGRSAGPLHPSGPLAPCRRAVARDEAPAIRGPSGGRTGEGTVSPVLRDLPSRLRLDRLLPGGQHRGGGGCPRCGRGQPAGLASGLVHPCGLRRRHRRRRGEPDRPARRPGDRADVARSGLRPGDDLGRRREPPVEPSRAGVVVADHPVGMLAGAVPALIRRSPVRADDLAARFLSVAVAALLFRHLEIWGGQPLLTLQDEWAQTRWVTAISMVLVSGIALFVQAFCVAMATAVARPPTVLALPGRRGAPGRRSRCGAGRVGHPHRPGRAAHGHRRAAGLPRPPGAHPVRHPAFAGIRETYGQTIRALSRLTEIGGLHPS